MFGETHQSVYYSQLYKLRLWQLSIINVNFYQCCAITITPIHTAVFCGEADAVAAERNLKTPSEEAFPAVNLPRGETSTSSSTWWLCTDSAIICSISLSLSFERAVKGSSTFPILSVNNNKLLGSLPILLLAIDRNEELGCAKSSEGSKSLLLLWLLLTFNRIELLLLPRGCAKENLEGGVTSLNREGGRGELLLIAMWQSCKLQICLARTRKKRTFAIFSHK